MRRLAVHGKDWYLKRIGKTVYRLIGLNECACEACIKARNDGILIDDQDQAVYLFDIQNECGFRYADKFPAKRLLPPPSQHHKL